MWRKLVDGAGWVYDKIADGACWVGLKIANAARRTFGWIRGWFA